MDIVNKLWGFCNKLRHDGVDSSDYIEQLTYLLFLKMAKEKGVAVPPGFDWESLLSKNNKSLRKHLEIILQKLRTKKGLLGDIFAEPVSRVRNAEILRALITEIDSIQWTSFDTDVVGLAFEELIGKVANEGKKGAGQYFTPRPLIQTIVNVVRPNPLESAAFKVADVAVGTAGFLLVASEWFKRNYNENTLSAADVNRIRNSTYYGQELVQRPRRLALMNMFLHGINAHIKLGDTIYGKETNEEFDCILTNPPFGNKGAKQIPDRNFPIKTSDKQLNFIQHVIEKLKIGGRAAIVVPDGCLNNEVARKIWAYYLEPEKCGLQVCNLHTILKLPEGVFAAYANGVKASVIFIEKGIPTKKTWIYDARKDFVKITTKSNVLSAEHFRDFEKSYGNKPNGNSNRVETDRFKSYSIKQIKKKKYDLSFTEVVNVEPLAHPVVMIDELIADYERKIAALKQLKSKLPPYINGHTTALASNRFKATGSNAKG